MPRAALRRVLNCLLAVLVVGMFTHGCDCGTQFRPPAGCQFACCTNQDCQSEKKDAGDPNASNWICEHGNTAEAYCAQKTTLCMTQSECCPGQVCNSAGFCADSFTQCTVGDGGDPQACNVAPGEQCIDPLGEPPFQAPGCSFQTCNATSDCAQGLTCFDNYCIGQAPCNGGCGPNEVCTPVNNTCFSLLNNSAMPSSTFPSSCEQTCGSGKILVFTNGLNVFNSCNTSMSALACGCETLPPLTSNDTALFSSAGIVPPSSTGSANRIMISAYDYQYGSLVLHTFQENDSAGDPKEVSGSPVWIDGIPDSGPYEGDPAGPRGGRTGPAENVGQWTSLAYDPSANAIHISYYDVADAEGNPTGNLKYARSVLDSSGNLGPWTTMVVDGVDSSGNKTADVGQYTSITLAPDGSPVIAYFQDPGMGAGGYVSALKVARATSNAPMSASDWTISTVEANDGGPTACVSGCQPGEQCGAPSGAGDGGTDLCYAAGTGCSPACTGSDFCGQLGNGDVACVTPGGTELAGIPTGDGLWPSITYPPSDWPSAQRLPVVVWYDNTSGGVLKGAVAMADNAAQGANFGGAVQTLDDGTQSNGLKDDVGQFTSIAVGPMALQPGSGSLEVTYYDATQNQLLAINSPFPGLSATKSVIDNGANTATADPELFVGANSSVKFNGSDIWVAYQDATGLSLRLAEQSSPTAPLAEPGVMPITLKSGEGYGFYTNLVIDTSSQYVSNAVIKADSASVSGNQLEVLLVP